MNGRVISINSPLFMKTCIVKRSPRRAKSMAIQRQYSPQTVRTACISTTRQEASTVTRLFPAARLLLGHNPTVHFFSTMKNGRMKYWLRHSIWRSRPPLTRRSPTSSPMMDTTGPIYGPRKAGGGAPTSTQRILFTGAAMAAKDGTRGTSIPGGRWHLTRR